ncbi:tRNA pseudouridine(55) synthase TruB [Mycoplasmopsis hyopharyngis]|uniref:tRNA pseudouridine(55) synthase TruB n=1 Tax=Mycoplasmopsis hyopharyngis TaxID=29558 RepID=UPI003873C92C
MFYLIYKEKNISSFQAIRKFAHKNKIKKIGHTGTLDPLASGLLLVATDEDTKLIPFIEVKDKTYVTTIHFGVQTSTYDAEGEIINSSQIKIKQEDLNKINQWLLEQTSQIPPIFSAKKVNGIRAYDLARKNKDVVLKPQNITVYKSQVLEFDFENQILKVELSVSNGTYIRSLVNDLALAFNTFAYMKDLERISISNLNKDLLINKNFAKIKYQQILPSRYFDSTKEEQQKLLMGHTLQKDLDNGIYFARRIDNANDDSIYGIVEVNNKTLKSKNLFGNRILKEN